MELTVGEAVGPLFVVDPCVAGFILCTDESDCVLLSYWGKIMNKMYVIIEGSGRDVQIVIQQARPLPITGVA
jgi:hypothetical protein